MRLILIVAMLLGTTMLHAQKFTLGLNAGMCYTEVQNPGPVKGSWGFNGSVRGLYTIGKLIEAGILLETGGLNVVRPAVFAGGINFPELKGHVARPFYLAGLLGNVKGKHVYAGAMLGYLVREPQYEYASLNVSDNSIRIHSSGAGTEKTVTIGGQAGYTVQLLKKISLNAEAGIRYLLPRNTLDMGRRSVVYFPVTLGVRYRVS